MNTYTLRRGMGLRLTLLSFCAGFLLVGCHKDSVKPTPAVIAVPPTVLDLYEYAVDTDKRVFIGITKIGTQAVDYVGIFDTGSTGMTMDAHDVIPSAMITSTGFSFTGDSVVVNGITITRQTGIISYGDKLETTKEYGSLAYAAVTIGDPNGTLVLKRIPFFLYYKVVDGKGKQFAAHQNDVFGVGPGYSPIIKTIRSPLSYSTGQGLTSGFKLATLNKSFFNTSGNAVSGLLSIGLTSDDIASGGFIMHPLAIDPNVGFSPNIPSTITYNNKTIAAQVLFDTGTPSVTIIEDRTANSIGELPATSIVKVTTNKGFVYQYTTSKTDNLTAIQNPNNTADFRTIFSLDFFISNEFLLNYRDNVIGLKNN